MQYIDCMYCMHSVCLLLQPLLPPVHNSMAHYVFKQLNPFTDIYCITYSPQRLYIFYVSTGFFNIFGNTTCVV